jgi:cyclic pyranopterin phosphate synthase
MRDLRISVTDRCNFRCSYCMPAELFGERYEFLPRSEILAFEEIERLARLFVGLGVTKLRITGGEPLLRADLPRLVERLAAIPGEPDLALTTNGVLLPGLAAPLHAAGLRRVTVSLDSVDPEVFLRMNGGKLSVERVLEGIEAAERAGLAPLKLNCVVQRGVNEGGVVDLARRFRGSGHVVRFIEYMDVGNRNGWDLSQVVPAEEIARRLDEALGIEPLERAYPGEVAERWRYRDGSGELGIIASVTRPFCGACTRARLTTDGRLVTCLFATRGSDLRGPLRAGASDDELRALLEGVWLRRGDRYSEIRAAATEPLRAPSRKLEMYELGG